MGIYADHQDLVFSDLATEAAPVAADALVIFDASAQRPKQATIGSLPIARAQVASGIREIANDGAVALVDTDAVIIIANSTTGNKAITTVSSYAGQQVIIRLVACTGNSYVLTLDDETTLTFNAAGECAVIVRNEDNTGWLVALPVGATIV